MKKTGFYENLMAFMLYAVLMTLGLDTMESINTGMWHMLVTIGIPRSMAEMTSALVLLWAVIAFSKSVVHFFYVMCYYYVGLCVKAKKEAEASE